MIVVVITLLLLILLVSQNLKGSNNQRPKKA